MSYSAFVWFEGALYQMFKAPDIYRKWQGTSHSPEQYIWDGEEMVLIEPEFEEPEFDEDEIEDEIEDEDDPVTEDLIHGIRAMVQRIEHLELRVQELEDEFI